MRVFQQPIMYGSWYIYWCVVYGMLYMSLCRHIFWCTYGRYGLLLVLVYVLSFLIEVGCEIWATDSRGLRVCSKDIYLTPWDEKVPTWSPCKQWSLNH